MSFIDDISSHIQNVETMILLLKDLDNEISQGMILSKITSSLLLSFNSILAIWTNVDKDK